MSYWRLFYHFTWATKLRQPLISAGLEPILFERLAHEAKLMGVPYIRVNGLSDHVHILAAVPPKYSLSDFAKQLKGASSYHLTQKLKIPFAWQKGFGVVTVSERQLPDVERYLDEQKQRHQNGDLIEILELTEMPHTE